MRISGQRVDFSQVPFERSEAAEGIESVLEGNAFDGKLSAEQVAQLCEGLSLERSSLMRRLVPYAALYAQVPLSNFKVGAVALGNSGALYFGANLEFSGVELSQTIHAEQAAVAHTVGEGEKGLQAIAISAAPCGHCRQFLNELPDARSIKVYLPGKAYSLPELLPDAFGPEDLDIHAMLGKHARTHLVLKDASDVKDEVLKKALQAAELSYSPYIGAYSGMVLCSDSGRQFPGYTIENAAYNPSMSSFASAWVKFVFSGEPVESLQRVVMVADSKSLASQEIVIRKTLASVSSAQLEVHTAEVVEVQID